VALWIIPYLACSYGGSSTYYKRGIIVWVVKEMGRSMVVMKYTTMDIFNQSLDDNRRLLIVTGNRIIGISTHEKDRIHGQVLVRAVNSQKHSYAIEISVGYPSNSATCQCISLPACLDLRHLRESFYDNGIDVIT
jgi:hypothetical protein